MTAAAIAGVFSDYKLVRTRSVVQIIVEVPVERQADVFAALGYPMPGQEINVAVARMNSPAGLNEPQPAKGTIVIADGNGPQTKPSTLPAGGRHKTPEERAVIRAAILCSEPRFQTWLAGEEIGTNAAASMLREACGVSSRADIAKDPEALDRFLKIETEYMQAVGLMASPR